MQDLSIRVGGEAGDGIATLGESFCRLFTRNGYHAHGLTSYQSVIRGGHVWFNARGSPDRIWSQGDGIDVLYALNATTVKVHASLLRDGGVVIYDPEKFSIDANAVPPGATMMAVPTLTLARKFASAPILQGSVGMGACTFLSGLPLETLNGILGDNFGRKGPDVLGQNLGAAKEGYDFAREKGKPLSRAFPPCHGPPKLFLSGNEALAMGAVAAGLKFLAQYPMTPASTIMHWMADHSVQLGVVVKQAEDELAAINMAIGAFHAGARAMTATSGGGFSLMVEALGMAGMTETPVVVALSQRSGPSTGLPTKTEQGDLDLMLGAGQGDFPRAIFAPGNVVEAYNLTREAFRTAEHWQTAVIIAMDFYLSENYQSADRADFSIDYDPPSLFTVPGPTNDSGYKRYALTPSGVSPQAFPGQKGFTFVAASDEHDEHGHLISDVLSGLPESLTIRNQMMEKRMRKLDGILASNPPPTLEGTHEAEVTFVAWGSTVSPVRDAMRELSSVGVKTNLLALSRPFPLHVKEVTRILRVAKKALLVEGNYTGKMGALIRRESGAEIPEKLLKYDGEPFYPSELIQKVVETMGGKEKKHGHR